MAERGAKVLVLEREKQFKDRGRGEAIVSWGVAEANELGICRLLQEKRAHEVPHVEAGSGLRDLRATTPQQLPILFLPASSDTGDAARGGRKRRRGSAPRISVAQIAPGAESAVTVDGPAHERIFVRLVAAVDGRGSAARKWAGFPICEQSNAYYLAGVLLTNVHTSTETVHAVFNPELGTCTGLIPQAGGQFRAYFVYPKTMGYRLQGAHSQVLTPATSGWNTRIAMAWCCSAMLPPHRPHLRPGAFFCSAWRARASRRTLDEFRLERYRTPLRRTASAEFSCVSHGGNMDTHPLSRSLSGSSGIAGESPATDCRGFHTRSRSYF
jgi:2-polyprenyl-6-methoxyphenol hydroxylase-like FAD-dependent oxidoreductase